jgi:hypothetical protein
MSKLLISYFLGPNIVRAILFWNICNLCSTLKANWQRFTTIQNKLTSMITSPSWKAERRSAAQEIPRLLWNPKFYYREHNSLLFVPISFQTNSVHTRISSFFKIYFNFILISFSHLHPTLPNCFFPSTFRNNTPAFLIAPIRATCPVHSFFDLINLITFCDSHKLWSS